MFRAITSAVNTPERQNPTTFEQFGLPACTTENGCFRKVDQRGGNNYPPSDLNWAGEISLGLDMISAIAPDASIILVEADSPADSDLGTAENMAVSLGAVRLQLLGQL
jgi:hypothetical protein